MLSPKKVHLGLAYSSDTSEYAVLTKLEEEKPYFPPIWTILSKELNWQTCWISMEKCYYVPPWAWEIEGALNPKSKFKLTSMDMDKLVEGVDYFSEKEEVLAYVKLKGFNRTKSTGNSKTSTQIYYFSDNEDGSADAMDIDTHATPAKEHLGVSYAFDTNEFAILIKLEQEKPAFQPIWKILQELSWHSYQVMKVDHYIPPWALEVEGAFTIDSTPKLLDITKLVEGVDYFLKKEDVIAYLRNNGFNRSTDENRVLLQESFNSTSVVDSTTNFIKQRSPSKALHKSKDPSTYLDRLANVDSSPMNDEDETFSDESSNHEDNSSDEESEEEEEEDDTNDRLVALLNQSNINFANVWSILLSKEEPWTYVFTTAQHSRLEHLEPTNGAEIIYIRPNRSIFDKNLIKNEDYFYSKDSLIDYLKVCCGIIPMSNYVSDSKKPRVTRRGTILEVDDDREAKLIKKRSRGGKSSIIHCGFEYSSTTCGYKILQLINKSGGKNVGSIWTILSKEMGDSNNWQKRQERGRGGASYFFPYWSLNIFGVFNEDKTINDLTSLKIYIDYFPELSDVIKYIKECGFERNAQRSTSFDDVSDFDDGKAEEDPLQKKMKRSDSLSSTSQRKLMKNSDFWVIEDEFNMKEIGIDETHIGSFDVIWDKLEKHGWTKKVILDDTFYLKNIKGFKLKLSFNYIFIISLRF